MSDSFAPIIDAIRGPAALTGVFHSAFHVLTVVLTASLTPAAAEARPQRGHGPRRLGDGTTTQSRCSRAAPQAGRLFGLRARIIASATTVLRHLDAAQHAGGGDTESDVAGGRVRCADWHYELRWYRPRQSTPTPMRPRQCASCSDAWGRTIHFQGTG
jgi:hypothetical protein